MPLCSEILAVSDDELYNRLVELRKQGAENVLKKDSEVMAKLGL